MHHPTERADPAEPVNPPYGYREYTARDNEVGLWSFMTPLDEPAAADHTDHAVDARPSARRGGSGVIPAQ